MLHDISPELSSDIAVFPGDTPLSRDVILEVERGDPVTLSTLRTTVHVGAHLDGANHYRKGGQGVDKWPLERCIGPCRVIRVDVSRGELIEPGHLADALLDEARVLLATGTYPDPRAFNTDFAALHPETVDLLAQAGVELVGVDTPSVDPADSKSLPAHGRFGAHGMTILEGIVLTDIEPGRYELLAAPLKLTGFDGSPVRALLRDL
ncbi:MAG: cyclase family protein [Phycisphaerales bacterium]|nr:cyclase family protein [Phycisphaerales bacterium]